ncbi:hypothetical protein FDP41_011442 [Naegleria fowleri]|uniref:SET domain-containing protein n=1 Tax=Naegleria fowleri TaxID=5763 RepID=A0A6A5C6N3_NAEFO|nr:uncharacterized protein FDP41_011442 [Naegleria fowleri]KAF0982512.1 hypothetical protein FDP41_011442 [Naegleria fowleri]CAG4707685.1 unnamed protein product [Naegleria fowleri]
MHEKNHQPHKSYVRIENNLDNTPFDHDGFTFIEERIIDKSGSPPCDSNQFTPINHDGEWYIRVSLHEEEELSEWFIHRQKQNPNITNHLLVDNSKCLFEKMEEFPLPFSSLINEGVTIRKHPFKNWSVFSNESISKGQFIAEYVGIVQPIITIRDGHLNTPYSHSNEYTFSLKNMEQVEIETHELCGKYYGNFTSFINHSCNPNVIAFHVLKVERKETTLHNNEPTITFTIKENLHVPHVYLFAKRNIEKDEELTLDYGHEYVEHVMNGKCLCGSKYCRY